MTESIDECFQLLSLVFNTYPVSQITNWYVRPPATEMSIIVIFFSSLAFSLMLTAEFFTFILKQMKDLPG